jgi:hypothetical protein
VQTLTNSLKPLDTYYKLAEVVVVHRVVVVEVEVV